MISAAVMSHPKRAARIPALQEAVPGLVVVHDPEPETKTNWSCARLAWKAFGAEATHHLVLEDDAVPCAAFMVAVERVVAARPDHCISLWANHKKITEAMAQGKTLVRAPKNWAGAVAVVMPVGWCYALVAYGDGATYNKAQDVPLREFLALVGVTTLWTVPSLVEHGEPEDSVLWGRKPMPIRRKARLWIGDTDLDPATLEWRGDG